MPSVLQPWVIDLGLRHQGTLMSAMRGCDIAPRGDPSKIAQRMLRAAVLEPHVGRYGNPKTYIWHYEPHQYWPNIEPFLTSWDHYPTHYTWHFIHATEIIGYHGPEEHPVFSHLWLQFYHRACTRFHINPESKEELSNRLNAPEDIFLAAQDHPKNPT